MPRYDKEQLLADWRTGEFKHQELADKHKMSRPNVARIVKDIPQDLASVLTHKIESEQELAELSDKELTIVDTLAKSKIEDAKMIRTMSKNNMVGLGKKLVQHEDMSISDHLAAANAIDRTSITLGVNDRHANGIAISNTVQTVTINKEDYAEVRSQMLINDDC